MARPVLYFARHGQTDWNAEARLQGQRDIPLNALGRKQAVQCAAILRDLFGRKGCAPGDFAYVSSPLVRASETMELMRKALGIEPGGYSTDPRLKEMSFGTWEGFTFPELQNTQSDVLAERERDKWGFVVPGGESYAMLTQRVGEWYETIERDTVVSAHGGVARALIAYLGIRSPEIATAGDIRQGVVYVFDDGALSCFA
jgi:broad specificity phosphatase PhoE